MTSRLDDASVEAFARDGAVCLRGVFAEEWIDTLRAGLEENLAAPGPDGVHNTEAGASGGFRDDSCNWQRIDAYRRFVFDSPAAELAAALLRTKAVRFYHEHGLVKEPGTREPTPWHQDIACYGVEGTQLLSLWIPLDPIPQATSPCRRISRSTAPTPS